MLIAGPQIMSGYFGNPEETRKALWIDEQGQTWLRTGDIVRADEDGVFQVLDRKKDMIIRAGLKVYPARVEKILMTDARVSDAAVIGRPDPVHNEQVDAFIVPASAEIDSLLLTESLRALCREHLAPYEVPVQFRYIDQIPRSALGKALKKELRALPDEDSPSEPQKPQKQRKAA